MYHTESRTWLRAQRARSQRIRHVKAIASEAAGCLWGIILTLAIFLTLLYGAFSIAGMVWGLG